MTATAAPRALLHLAAALAVLLLAAPAAARADAAQVTVVSPGGTAQTIALDALAGQEDVSAAYTLRGPEGEARPAISGFSLGKLIDVAGADPFTFSYLEVQRPAGGAVLLSRGQALQAQGFADGPPVVYAAASGTGFLRPATGAGDLNAADSFEAPQGITIVLRKGTPLKVSVKASTQRTEAGKAVTFSATAEGAGAGEELTFSWYFDDGVSAEGSRVQHTFKRRGSYDVVVGVTTPSDRTGATAVVTVQVGEPIGGPDRKGGGRNRSAGAPDHGAADGPASGSGRGVPSGGSGAAGPLPSTGPAAAPRPAPAPRPASPRPSAPRREPRPVPTEIGAPVSGELIGAPVDATQPLETGRRAAARTGKLDNEGGGGLSGTALGVLATLGLIGLGAGLEARGVALLRRRGA